MNKLLLLIALFALIALVNASNVKLVVDMPDEGRRDLADATLYGRVGVFAEVEEAAASAELLWYLDGNLVRTNGVNESPKALATVRSGWNTFELGDGVHTLQIMIGDEIVTDEVSFTVINTADFLDTADATALDAAAMAEEATYAVEHFDDDADDDDDADAVTADDEDTEEDENARVMDVTWFWKKKKKKKRRRAEAARQAALAKAAAAKAAAAAARAAAARARNKAIAKAKATGKAWGQHSTFSNNRNSPINQSIGSVVANKKQGSGKEILFVRGGNNSVGLSRNKNSQSSDITDGASAGWMQFAQTLRAEGYKTKMLKEKAASVQRTIGGRRLLDVQFVEDVDVAADLDNDDDATDLVGTDIDAEDFDDSVRVYDGEEEEDENARAMEPSFFWKKKKKRKKRKKAIAAQKAKIDLIKKKAAAAVFKKKVLLSKTAIYKRHGMSDEGVNFASMNLDQYHAIVMGSNNAHYSLDDVDAVDRYVRLGGSVLMISDANFGNNFSHAPSSDQDFMNRWGVEMNQDNASHRAFPVSSKNKKGLYFTSQITDNVKLFSGSGVSPVTIRKFSSPTIETQIIAGFAGQIRRNDAVGSRSYKDRSGSGIGLPSAPGGGGGSAFGASMGMGGTGLGSSQSGPSFIDVGNSFKNGIGQAFFGQSSFGGRRLLNDDDAVADATDLVGTDIDAEDFDDSVRVYDGEEEEDENARAMEPSFFWKKKKKKRKKAAARRAEAARKAKILENRRRVLAGLSPRPVGANMEMAGSKRRSTHNDASIATSYVGRGKVAYFFDRDPFINGAKSSTTKMAYHKQLAVNLLAWLTRPQPARYVRGAAPNPRINGKQKITFVTGASVKKTGAVARSTIMDSGSSGFAALNKMLSRDYLVTEVSEGNPNQSSPQVNKIRGSTPAPLAAHLKTSQVLVFGSNNAKYTPAQIKSVITYIMEGGSALFVATPHWGGRLAYDSDNQFMQYFGWELNGVSGNAAFSRAGFNDVGVNRFFNHRLFGGVTRFSMRDYSSVTLSRTNVRAVESHILAGSPGNVRTLSGARRQYGPRDGSILTAFVGRGKVAFIGDPQMMMSGNLGANSRFVNNVFSWLVKPQPAVAQGGKTKGQASTGLGNAAATTTLPSTDALSNMGEKSRAVGKADANIMWVIIIGSMAGVLLFAIGACLGYKWNSRDLGANDGAAIMSTAGHNSYHF